MRQKAVRFGVDTNAVKRGKTRAQIGVDAFYLCVKRGKIGRCLLGGRRHGANAWHRFGSRAKSVFLAAAGDARHKPHALAHKQRTDAFGRMNLVCTDTDKIRFLPNTGRNFGERLHCVGVKERIRTERLSKRSKRSDVVNRAGLVVDRHAGHQNRVGRQNRPCLVEIQLAAPGGYA